MSKQPYWITLHDRIFEIGTSGSMVAKNGTKRLIHISAVWRATELKFGIWVNYSQIYYWNPFWCYGSQVGFLLFRSGPLKLAPVTCGSTKQFWNLTFQVKGKNNKSSLRCQEAAPLLLAWDSIFDVICQNPWKLSLTPITWMLWRVVFLKSFDP